MGHPTLCVPSKLHLNRVHRASDNGFFHSVGPEGHLLVHGDTKLTFPSLADANAPPRRSELHHKGATVMDDQLTPWPSGRQIPSASRQAGCRAGRLID
jgi:hypothetical protein